MRELDLQAILAGADEALPDGHRSGLVALVGRPNVGKSTLLNAMVGEKVAIVTDVPGTTRNAIRGVVTRADAQIVFLDTPGIAKPRTLLTRRLNELVRETWSGVEAICFLVDVADGVGSGDAWLAEQLRDVNTPIVIVANKEDLVRRDKAKLVPELTKLAELLPNAEVVPTSAADGFNVAHLLDVLVGVLPEGPRMFPDGTVSDQPEQQLASEIIREKFITRMSDELPHSIAIVIDDFGVAEHREDLIEIRAAVVVERDSQKGIVIGKGGKVLKAAATAARRELEVVLGTKVYLDLRVKVAKEWQKDPRQLGRLGY